MIGGDRISYELKIPDSLDGKLSELKNYYASKYSKLVKTLNDIRQNPDIGMQIRKDIPDIFCFEIPTVCRIYYFVDRTSNKIRIFEIERFYTCSS